VPALGAIVCGALVIIRVGTGDWRAPALAGAMLLGILAVYAVVQPRLGDGESSASS
jgi:hypothetical protein